MPMRLRNGRIYTAFKSEHIMLRDGKIVEALQSVIFNKLYVMSYQGEIGFVAMYNKFEINNLSKFQHNDKELNHLNPQNDTSKKYGQFSIIANFIRNFGFLPSENISWFTLVSFLYFIKFLVKVVWYIVSMILVVYLLLSWTQRSTKLPHPFEFGLKSGHEVFLKPNKEVFAWHVMPKSARLLKALPSYSDNSSVVFHIRNQGYIDSHNRIDVFRSLASIGYHVLVPMETRSYDQILEAWIIVFKKAATNAHKYLWVDRTEMSLVKKLMQEACRLGFPPSGVLVETKKTEISNTHIMEVWTEECKDRHFNFLRCPITSQSVTNREQEILSCMNLISANTHFSARY